MKNNRRSFILQGALIGLGITLFGAEHALGKTKPLQTINYDFSKKNGKQVLVKGILRNKRLDLVPNAEIKIYTTVLRKGKSKCVGVLRTDQNGKFSFLSDYPEKDFEQGHGKTRQISLQIEDEGYSNLYIDHMGYAATDSSFIQNSPIGVEDTLPKTAFQSEKLTIIHFNLFTETN